MALNTATRTRLPSMKDLIAVDSTGQLKAVGFVTWFSVPDVPVALRSLRKQLIAHGLPKELAPKDTKAVNAFKRVMAEHDGRRRENGHIRENVVKMVEETPRHVVYQVSTTVRNLDEQIIDFPKALRVIFTKGDEEIRFNKLPEVPSRDVAPIMETIEAEYEKNVSKVTGAKVRTIVRNYLSSTPDEERGIEGLSGENLRERAGGIYFVPARHQDELTQLGEMLDELYHGKAFLHMLPMADTASAREIIRRHHKANALDDVKQLLKDADKLSGPDRERTARSDAVGNKFAQYHQLQRRLAEYRDILGEDIEEALELSSSLKKKLDRLMG
jgi:hypothetical protein